MHIENIGNVPSSPYKVSMKIYDVTGQQLLESVENTNSIDQILPFDTKKVVAYLPTWLPPGGYRVKYSIEKDDKRNAQQGELALSILPMGTITGYEQYGFEGLTLKQQLTVFIPTGALLGIIVLVIFLRGRKQQVRRPAREHEDDPPPPARRVEREQVTVRPRPQSSNGVVDLSRRR